MSTRTVPTGGSGRRRRPRRGSLSRPVNSGLYRASLLVVLLPLLLLAFSVEKPAPLAKPTLPGSFDTAAAVALAEDLSTAYPNRTPGAIGACELVQEPAAGRNLRAQAPDVVVAGARAGARAGPPSQRRRGGAGAAERLPAGHDRRDGASGRPRARAGRERQRERHGGADRARARLCAAADRGCRSGDLAAAHRVPLDRRRRRRRARRRALPRPSPLSRPHRLRDQPRRDRRDGEPEHRDRRRHRALAERDAGGDHGRADRGADRRGAAPRRVSGTADRSGVPVHALRAGTVRRRRNPGPDDHDRRRPSARALRRHRGHPRPDAARTARRRHGAAARLARPGTEPAARAAAATSGWAGGSSAAGRSSSF